MGFEVGDWVVVRDGVEATKDYRGRRGIVKDTNMSFSIYDTDVLLDGDSDGDTISFHSTELILESALAPEVGDTVRVTFEGKVDIVDVTGGVRVTTPGGENAWFRHDSIEVTSKAVKEPVVLGVGDKVVEGATAPVGALAGGAGLTPLMFDGEGWVYVTTPSVYATNAVVLSSYVVTFVPPVINSK